MFSVGILVGDLSTIDREKAFYAFRKGLQQILVTTSIASRGIDVPTVDVVINFDLPKGPGGSMNSKEYVYRAGRTGRFGRNGVAINLFGPEYSQHALRISETCHKSKFFENN